MRLKIVKKRRRRKTQIWITAIGIAWSLAGTSVGMAATTTSTQPPTIDAGGPYAVDLGDSVELVALAEDPDGGLVNVVWDLDGDGVFDDAFGASAVFDTNVLGSVGSNTVSVRVTDDEGETVTVSATVAVKVVPVVDAGGPYFVDEGGTVGLAATGSDADGGSVSIAWDFDGDGVFDDASGTSVSFDTNVFGAPGWNTVSAQVTDDEGDSVTDSTTVRIFSTPTLDAGGPYSVNQGFTVDLTANAADPDGVTHSEFYGWTFSTAITGPRFVETGDLDGDGDADVIVTRCCEGPSLLWFENLGGGSFSSEIEISSLAAMRAPALADIDGDGDLDLVASAQGLHTFENDGTGTFSHTAFSDKSYTAVVLADFDGDGDADLVGSPSPQDNYLDHFENDGSGSFTETYQIYTRNGQGAYEMVAADFDQDGDIDLVSVTGSYVQFYRNNLGAGLNSEFTRADIGVSGSGTSVVAGDFDGDGDLDLVHSSNNHGNTLSFWRNDGNIDIDPFAASYVTIWSNPNGGIDSLVAADLDDDGDLDLASASQDNSPGLSSDNDRSVRWFENDGSASFEELTIVPSKTGGYDSLAVAELNGDGALDLITTTRAYNDVDWFRQYGSLTIEWDLNNDGQFGDATGATVSFDPDGLGSVGSNTVSVRVTDDEGETVTDSTTVEIFTLPVVDPAAGSGGSYVVDDGDAILLVATAEDPDGGSVSVAWDLDNDGAFDDASGLYVTFDTTVFGTPGSNTVSARVTDDEGDSVTESTTVEIFTPPTDDPGTGSGESYVVEEGGLYAVDLGDSVELVALAEDPDGGLVNVVWDLDGDGVFDDAFGASAVFDTNVLGSVGSNTVSVRVTDDEGETVTVSATVAVKVVPVVDAGGPYFVDEGGTVGLAATGSDADGGSVSIAWDFDGDGVFDDASGTSVSFDTNVFGAPGWNTVSAQVTDDEGDSVTDSTTVRIFSTPTLDAGGPYSVNQGFTVDLTANAADPDGVTHSEFYGWTFSTAITGPRFVETGDLDGDGDADVIVTRCCEGPSLLWFENLGGGSFSSEIEISSLAAMRAPALADIDGDGDLDLVASAQGLHTFENDGTGTFSHTAFSDKSYTAVVLADFDGDGDADLVGSPSPQDNYLDHFENDGSGSFTETYQIYTRNGQGAYEMVAADFDQDGDIDLVSVTGSYVQFYRNNLGAGLNSEFTRADIGVSGSGTSVVAGDFDGDGDLDLVHSSNNHGNTLSFWRNDGNIDIDPFAASYVTIWSNPNGGIDSLVAADLDDDGDLDLASASQDNSPGLSSDNDRSVRWFENDGSASFEELTIVPSKTGGYDSLAVAELNGDGALDLITTTRAYNDVDWFRQYGSLTIEWDLNNDGQFGDATGATVSFDPDGLGSVGSNTVSVRVTDDEGETVTDSTTVEIFTLPVVDPAAGSGGSYVVDDGDAILLVATAEDPDGGSVSVAWDLDNDGAFDDASGLYVTFDTTVFGTPGSNTVSARVTDDEGDSVTESTTVEIFTPPTDDPGTGSGESYVVEEGGLYAVDLGDSVELVALAEDPDGGLVNVVWDLDGDGVFDDAFGASAVFDTNVLGSVGSNTVSVRVTDDEGETVTVSATVAVKVVPVVDAGGPYFVDEGGTVGLAATGSDADGGSVSIAWDFDGDGVFDDASGTSVSFDTNVFGAPGWNTVSAQVTDDEGDSVTDSTTVRIFSTPTLDAGGPYSVNQGFTVDLTANAADPDGVTHSEFYGWTFSTAITGPRFVETGDLDGDGDADVIVTRCCEGPSLLWFENLGGGSFSSEIEISSLAAMRAPALADIDGDGDLDLVASAQGLHTFENDGTGTFSHTAFSDKSYTAVVLADFDGDGDADLVGSPSPQDNYLDHFENDGSGSFTETYQIYTRNGQGAYEMVAADFDQDGDIDLVSVTGSYVQFYRNNLGAGLNSEFTRADIGVSGSGTSVVAGDFDGDGDLDLVHSSNNHGNTLSFWRNDGNIDIDPFAASYVTIWSNPNGGIDSLVAADLDDDGDLDLASASQDNSPGLSSDNDRSVRWFENDGSASFEELTIVPSKTGGYDSLAVAELNGDGALDLITTTRAYNDVDWFRQYGSLTIEWDLNNDGQFGDATGATVSFDPDGLGSVGSNTVSVRVTDDEGETVTDSTTVEIFTLPVVDPAAGSGGSYVVDDGDAILLVATAEDPDGGSVSVAWDLDNDGAFDDASGLYVTFDTTVFGTPGSNTVSARVTDDEGDSVTESTTVEIFTLPTVDTGGPYVVDNGDTVLLAAAASDADGGLVNVVWDLDGDGVFDDVTGTTASFDTTELGSVGSNTVSVRVTDDEGETVTASTTVAVKVVPVVDAGGPYFVDEGGTVGLAATGSDADGGSVSIAWDFDGDGVFDDASGTSVSFDTNVFGAPGWNTVSAQVTDDEGDSVTDSTTVRIFSTPTLDAGGPYSVNQGFTVDLTANAADPDGATHGEFSTANISAVAETPAFVATGDLDGDGDTDVIVHAGGIKWFENLGDGSFSSEIQISLVTGTADLAVGDIDGDSDLDFVVAGTDGVHIFENNGTGTFSSTVVGETGSYIKAVLLSDLDGDGDADLVAGPNDGDLYRYKNDGNGSFIESDQIMAWNGRVYDMSAADFDSDGDTDIAVLFEGHLYFLRNDGAQGFTDFYIRNHGYGTSVIAGDFDADGDVDLATSHSFGTEDINFYRNDGNCCDSLFTYTGTVWSTPAGEGGVDSLVAADLDADGDLDIVSVSRDELYGDNDRALRWFENDGSASFEETTIVQYRRNGFDSLAVADLNGDKALDIVTTTWRTNDVEWYRQYGSLAIEWDLNNNGQFGDATGATVSFDPDVWGSVGANTVSVRVTDDEGETVTDSTTVEIFTLPTVDAGGPYSVDDGDGVLLVAAASDADGGSVSIEWDLDGDGVFDDASGMTASFYTTAFGAPGLNTVSVRVTDDEGDSVTDSATVEIFTLPTVDAGGPYSVDDGDTVGLTATGSDADGGSVSIEWDFDGDGVFGDASGAKASFDTNVFGAPGLNTVSVRVTDDEGETVTDSTTVEIFTLPTVDIGGPYVVDDGDTVGLTATGSDADGGSVSIEWDLDGDGVFDDASGTTASFDTNVFGAPGSNTVSVRVTDDEGYSVTDSTTVGVKVAPAVDIGGPYVVDDGDTVGLTATGSDADGGSVSIEWDFDGDGVFDDASGATASFDTNVFGAPGLNTVSAQVTDDEGDSVTDSTTVEIFTLPTVDAGGPYSVDDGDTVGLAAAGSDADGGSVSIEWDFDGDGVFDDASGATASFDTNVFGAPGLNTVSVRVTDDEGDSVTDSTTVEIFTLPTVDAGGPYSVDDGDTVLLAAAASDADGGSVSIEWDLDGDGVFGDASGATASFDTNVFGSVGSNTVSVRVTDDEGETVTASTTVGVKVVPVVDIGGPYVVDDGDTVGLAAAGSDADGGSVSIEWDFDGDGVFDDASGATASFDTTVFGAPGLNTVSVRVTDDEGDSVTDSATVEIFTLPTVDAGGPYSVDDGDTVLLAAAASDADGGLVNVVWDLDGDGVFDDVTGTTASFDTTVLGSIGSNTVSVRVTDDEGETVTASTTVGVKVVPVVDIGGPYVVDDGDTVGLAAAGSDADGGSVSIEWDFDGDGVFDDASGTTASFDTTVFGAPGLNTVSVRVTDDEGDSVTDSATVEIFTLPTVDAGGPYSVDDGDTVLLAAAASDADGGSVSIEWDLDGDGVFGDASGATASFDTNVFGSVGSNTVSVRVTDDEGETVTDSTTVGVKVAPTVDAGGPYSVDDGDTVGLAAAGSDADGGSVSIEWDFDGDGVFDDASGATASFDTTVFGAPGLNTVSVRVTDDEGDSVTDSATVEIFTLPTVDAGGPYSVDDGDTVLLAAAASDADGGSVSIEWDLDGDGVFDDASGATASFDTNVFGSVGSNTVSVRVTDDEGETVTESTTVNTASVDHGFGDVPKSGWRNDAVSWMRSSGVTTGCSSTSFCPDRAMTREQQITFLWRYAGRPSPGAPAPFIDVEAGKYYTDPVSWAYNNGITNGVSPVSFGTGRPITRAQAVTFLWRQAGEPAPRIANPFADVPAGTYYTDPVRWAFETGITTGTSSTTFAPNQAVTRVQFAAFLSRFDKLN